MKPVFCVDCKYAHLDDDDYEELVYLCTAKRGLSLVTGKEVVILTRASKARESGSFCGTEGLYFEPKTKE